MLVVIFFDETELRCFFLFVLVRFLHRFFILPSSLKFSLININIIFFILDQFIIALLSLLFIKVKSVPPITLLL